MASKMRIMLEKQAVRTGFPRGTCVGVAGFVDTQTVDRRTSTTRELDSAKSCTLEKGFDFNPLFLLFCSPNRGPLTTWEVTPGECSTVLSPSLISFVHSRTTSTKVTFALFGIDVAHVCLTKVSVPLNGSRVGHLITQM